MIYYYTRKVRYSQIHKKAACPPQRGDPPDERKEGDANVCYIFGLDPDRYLHCRSRWIVLHNLREKKIAATTAIVTAVTM